VKNPILEHPDAVKLSLNNPKLKVESP